jgi:cyanate permease
MRILDLSDLASVFFSVGMMTAAVAPLSWIVVRDRPETYGLQPDGLAVATLPASAGRNAAVLDLAPGCGTVACADLTSRDSVWGFSEMVRTQAFWKVGLAYALVLMGVVGVMFQLAPRFIDIGYDRQTAMLLICATALVGTVGKTVWGMLCDRFDPRRVAAVLMAMNGLGLAMALLPSSFFAVILFVVLYGFAMGGVNSTFPILIADLFGRQSFAQVARFLSLLLILDAAGYLVMGQSFDRTGSYNPAYVLFIFLNIAAAGVIFSTKRPVRPPAGELA